MIKKISIISIVLIISITFFMTQCKAEYTSYIWSSPTSVAITTSSSIGEEYTNDTSNPLNLDCRICNIDRTKYR